MSRKKITVHLITGVLIMMIIIIPILRLFGVPSAKDLLTNLFGDNNPLVLVIILLAIVLLVVSFYKTPKK